MSDFPTTPIRRVTRPPVPAPATEVIVAVADDGTVRAPRNYLAIATAGLAYTRALAAHRAAHQPGQNAPAVRATVGRLR